MSQSDELPISEDNAQDPSFRQQVQRLHQLTVYFRWLFVACLWLTLAPWSLWVMRSEIAMLQQYFTWVAVKYGLLAHPIAALGLTFCIGMTAAVLIWQSRNILFGLPKTQQERLEKQVCLIRQQGSSHPLWRWVCQS